MHIFAIFNGLSYVNVFTYYGGHRGLVLIINNYRMKKIYLLICAVLLAQGAMAIDYEQLKKNSKINAMSKIELAKLQTQEEKAVAQSKATGSKLKALQKQMDNRTLRAIVKMTPGTDAAILADDGITVTSVVNHFAIVSMPLAQLEQLAERSDVVTISFAKRRKRMLLSKAHASTGVDKIHLGTGLTQPYTGKGVAIGVLDGGFDPNHIMFLDAQGKSRFKMIGYAAKEGDNLTYLTTPEQIAAYQTDDKEETHATHVSGMAAGNYQGSSFQIKGVAPEADLLMGPIPYYESDYEMFDKMVNWCKDNGGKRLVVNMSYGANAGSHDTTDPEVAFMDEFIKKYDVVNCIAAGNEADYDIVQRRTFTGATGEVMKAAYVSDLDADGVTDVTEIYNYFTVTQPEKQVEIDIVLYNVNTGVSSKTWRFVNASNPNGRKQTYNSNYFKGTVSVTAENIANGMKGYVLNISDITFIKDNYALGYVVRAKEGQTVTSYLESTTVFDTDIKGCDQDITHDGTINSIACGTEAIVVGAYNTVKSYQAIDGYTYGVKDNFGRVSYGNKVGDIAFFSSYGKLADGRVLPHVCAPGLFVQSSYSRYTENYEEDVMRQETVAGTMYEFGQMSGTSMATPYMSGVCALWLEADPTLTHTQIREIAQTTAISDAYCTTNNYYTKAGDGNQAGSGKVDAYKGLKLILDNKASGLAKIEKGKDFMIRALNDYTFEAYTAGAVAMSAALYSSQGHLVASASQAGNTVTISAAGQNKGVYILRISDGKQTHAQKVVVR